MKKLVYKRYLFIFHRLLDL